MKYINCSVSWDTHAWREDRGCCQDYPLCFTIAWISSRSLKKLMKFMAGDFLSSMNDVAWRQHFFGRNAGCYRKTRCYKKNFKFKSSQGKHNRNYLIFRREIVLDITWKRMLVISKITGSYWKTRKAVSVCI